MTAEFSQHSASGSFRPTDDALQWVKITGEYSDISTIAAEVSYLVLQLSATCCNTGGYSVYNIAQTVDANCLPGCVVAIHGWHLYRRHEQQNVGECLRGLY